MAEQRRGVLLGVDVGSVRVGVAVTDASGILASPLTTVARDAETGQDIDDVIRITEQERPEEVVVGLPVSLDGQESHAARSVRAWTDELRKRAPHLVIRLVDERLTTSLAHRMMGAAGRGSRARREVVDQAAAVAILETVLDAQRQQGSRPGTVLGVHAPASRKTRARQKERNG